MNLFIMGLNVPQIYFDRASKQLDNACEIFSNLKGGEKFAYQSSNLRNFVIMRYSAKELLGQRSYLSDEEEQIVFYSGLPVDPSKQILAHKANEISRNFNGIKYDLEGQTLVLRFNKRTSDADIITDSLGIEQGYYCFNNNGLLVSNNIHLIERVILSNKLDSEGMSYYLGIGWIGSDCTLKEDIKLIPGGQHWRWSSKQSILDRKTYFDPSLTNVNTKEALSKDNIGALAENLKNCYSALAENFEIECPLTGGQDSRLVAGLLINKGINAKYYTSGHPLSSDVIVASLIAKKFNLRHNVYETDTGILNNSWDELVKEFILKTCGMASLWNITDVLPNFGIQNKINVRLTTHGITIAKVAYNRPHLLLNDIGSKDIIKHLEERVINDACGIVSSSAIHTCKEYISRFVNESLEKSINIKVLPDLFCLLERVRRYHGNNWYIERDSIDFFDVFSTKDFLSTGMKLYPLEKITSPIHFRLLKLINKELLEMPFEGGKEFGIQNIKLKLFIDKKKQQIKKEIKKFTKEKETKRPKKGVEGFNRLLWFKQNLVNIKTVIMDQASSELWSFINRAKLENVLAGKGEQINPVYLNKLYIIATLFYNEII